MATQDPPEMELLFVHDRNVLWDNAAVGNVQEQEQQPDMSRFSNGLSFMRNPGASSISFLPQGLSRARGKGFFEGEVQSSYPTKILLCMRGPSGEIKYAIWNLKQNFNLGLRLFGSNFMELNPRQVVCRDSQRLVSRYGS